jgi:serine/threonine-protein kinase
VAPVSTPEPSRRFILSGILGAVAALVASIGGVLYFWPSPRSSNPSSLPARFSLKLPEGQRLPQNPRPFFAFSPDGSRLVYVAEEAGSRERLYLRALDEFEASPLPGTEGALNPFFSADGEWVGFFTNLRLWKIAVAGGNPIPIADALEGFGGTWSEDDTMRDTLQATPKPDISSMP